MFEDDEEIYDDTGDFNSEMSEPTGLSAIKARFEQAQNKFDNAPSPGPKPGITAKPKVFPKYGGGGGLNICAVGDKKDDNAAGGVKKLDGVVPRFQGAIKEENGLAAKDKTPDTGASGPVKKRDSKVNIPEAFRKLSDDHSPDIKPKPSIKTNKWNSDSNNNAKNIENIANAIAQKKPGLVGKGKPTESENTSGGKVSPRGKPSEANIPKTQSESTPKAKISPRGINTGAGVLAQVAKLAGEANGPVDIRSKLRHVETNKNSVKSTPLSPKKTETDSTDVPWRRNLRSAKVHERTKSIRTVVRVIDGKKFLKVAERTIEKDNAPQKPEKLDCDIDLEALENDFKEAIEKIVVNDKAQHGWTEMEEEYDDCGNLQPISSRAVSLMGSRPKPKPRKSKVPLIEPMTEDEELHEETQWKEAGFEGLPDSPNKLPAPPPALLDEQETYDDVAVAPAPAEEEEVLEQDEMYEELPEEPLPESPPPVPGPKPSLKPPEVPSTPLPKTPHVDKSAESEAKPAADQTPDAKEQKRLEKERKKKEKEEKKMLEKKEKELKILLKVLGNKVTAEVLTMTVGKGKVKKNAKGKEKSGELTVTEGEEVDIIRMVDNPAGKWLVRILSSQKEKGSPKRPYSPMEMIGYCDEKNIEVDTDSILSHRNIRTLPVTQTTSYMKGKEDLSSTSSLPAEPDQETYEAVEGEDLIEDEIYEECN